MQKTLDFLEQHVQWLALGLAGLVLLWVTYAYVLTPVTIKVGSRELTPGEVDVAVKRDAADNFAGRLATHSERHESLLARGYVVVRDGAERVVTDAVKVRPNTALELEFYDGKVGAIAGGSRRPVKRTVPPIGQGDLFKEP